jgi:hypothetical protein
MRKIIYLLFITTGMAGCIITPTTYFKVQNTVGKNIDAVIADFENSGLHCGEKGRARELFTNKLIGNVVCSVRERGFFCPKSYITSISYDLDTNIVTSFGKETRDNCF